MLFILDQDVSVQVAVVLRQAGHRCHTVASAGLAQASDDEVSVFAHDRNGVLLTHDSELFQRRRDNTFGHHILLKCNEWDAPQYMIDHLGPLIELIEGRPDAICAALTRDGLKIYPTKWK